MIAVVAVAAAAVDKTDNPVPVPEGSAGSPEPGQLPFCLQAVVDYSSKPSELMCG